MRFKRLTVFLVIGLLALSLAGCADANDNKETTAQEGQDVIAAEVEEPEAWLEYTNENLGYSIDLPRDWSDNGKMIETTDGSGITLFNDDENIDMSILGVDADVAEKASNIMDDVDTSSFEQSEIELENGEKAIVMEGLDNGFVYYEMVIEKDGTEYHFVSKTPEEFFNENRETIERMVQSLNLSNTSDQDVSATTEGQGGVVMTKDAVIDLENDFFYRAFQEADEDFLILNFTNKKDLHDYIAEVASDEVAQEIVNEYYVEDKSGLYTMNKEEPVRIVADQPIDLSEVSPTSYTAVQQGENDLYGEYMLTITYTYEDGEWIMTDRELEEL